MEWMSRNSTVDKGVENVLSVFLDQVGDVAKDSTGEEG